MTSDTLGMHAKVAQIEVLYAINAERMVTRHMNAKLKLTASYAKSRAGRVVTEWGGVVVLVDWNMGGRMLYE